MLVVCYCRKADSRAALGNQALKAHRSACTAFNHARRKNEEWSSTLCDGCLSAGLAFGQSSALQLTQRIALPNVDGRMDHMGIDIAGQRLFATAFDNHTLSVIDLKAGQQVRLIPDLDEPQAAYYDAATNHLFVSAGGDGSVKMFDGKTFELLRTIKYSADSDNLRYDAKNKHVIVGYGGEKFLYGAPTRQQGDGAMGIMDLAAMKVARSPRMRTPSPSSSSRWGAVSSSMSRTRRKFRWPTLPLGRPSPTGR